jgi:hypothetical protein
LHAAGAATTGGVLPKFDGTETSRERDRGMAKA